MNPGATARDSSTIRSMSPSMSASASSSQNAIDAIEPPAI